MADVKEYITFEDDRGTINISEDVVAAAAGSAAMEVDGVAGLYNTPGRDIAEKMGRKGTSKGVKIQVENREIKAVVSVLAELGANVNTVGENVQDAVKSAVEATTGLSVASVNVNIAGLVNKKK